MSLYYLISVYIHVICAAVWIGGMVALPLVMLPSIKNHPDRVEILYRSGLKLRTVGWITLIILLVSGLTNIHFRGLPLSAEFFLENNYGRLAAWKLLLFAAILLVSAVHDFMIGGKAIEDMKISDNSRMRKVARWTGRMSLLMALAAAFLGIVISRGGF